jgi:HEAT repeat protein
MTPEEFNRRIQAILGNVGERGPSETQSQVLTMIERGVRSWEQLLTFACDRTAPTELRETACWLLERLQGKRAAPTLLALFRDPNEDPGVRCYAATALAFLGSRRVVPGLTTVLQGKEDGEIRRQAAYALGFIGDSRSYQPLVSALTDPLEHLGVRCDAAEALGHMNETRAVPALLAMLRDPHPEVRFWAAFGLGQTAGPEVIPELERLAETDHTVVERWWSVSKEARDAMESIRRNAVWRAGEEAEGV